MDAVLVVWVAAVVAVLLAWFRVHPAFALYLTLSCSAGVGFGARSLLFAAAALAPPLYVAVVFGALAMRRKRPLPELFALARTWPLGGLVFDRLLIAVSAPHKSVYGLRTVRWTSDELVMRFDCSFFLRNPFASVDVGALVGMGELVAFAATLHHLERSGRRAIPTGVKATFVKKSKGRLTVSARAQPPPAGAASGTVSAEIRDARGDLCSTVYVEFAIGEATKR